MNGLWRAMLPFANEEQIERFVRPQVATEIKVAFTLTEPDAGTGADIKSLGRARGRHLLPQRPEAPDHVRLHLRLPAAVRAARGHARRRRHGRADGARPRRGHPEQPDARVDGRARDRPRAPVFDRAPGAGRQPAGRGGRGTGRRARRLPGAEPDLGGDDLRRAGRQGARPRRRVLQAARDLRQADRVAPGDRLPPGGDGDRPRGRAAADALRGGDLGEQRTTPPRSHRWRSCSPPRCCSA